MAGLHISHSYQGLALSIVLLQDMLTEEWTPRLYSALKP